MKKISPKMYVAVGVTFVVLAVIVPRFLSGSPDSVFRAYYAAIDRQERVAEDVTITDDDRKTLADCRSGKDNRPEKDCIRDFYDAYTMKNGVERAFLHLARTQSELPDSLRDCHYFSHGIGNAAYRLSGKDPYKAFDAMQSGAVYKNIATCGNGYFHGVVEELAAGEKDPVKLEKKLETVCSDNRITRRANCYHGAGHAAIIQMGFDIKKMLTICDNVPGRPSDVFSCYTGGFMEYTRTNMGISRTPDGGVKLELCDSLDKKYQPACYTELSYFMERLAKDPSDFANNIGQCKAIGDPLNRMSCVKLFAIRSVRTAHYSKIREMCDNISSDYEKVMCVAVVADKIAGSLDDSRKTDTFRKTLGGICGMLQPSFSRQCVDIVTRRNMQLFYTSQKDLEFPELPELSKPLSPKVTTGLR